MKKRPALLIAWIGVLLFGLFIGCQNTQTKDNVTPAASETEPSGPGNSEQKTEQAQRTDDAAEEKLTHEAQDTGDLDYAGLHKLAVERLMEGNAKNTPAHSEEERARAIGLIEQSILYCTIAIEMVPEGPWPYYTRGRAYLSLGEIEKAKADLERSCELGAKQACDELVKL